MTLRRQRVFERPSGGETSLVRGDVVRVRDLAWHHDDLVLAGVHMHRRPCAHRSSVSGPAGDGGFVRLGPHLLQLVGQPFFRSVQFRAARGDPLRYFGVRHIGERRSRAGRSTTRSRTKADESGCTPGSVPEGPRGPSGDGHPSRTGVATGLQRSTRGLGRAALERPRRALFTALLLTLLRVGFT